MNISISMLTKSPEVDLNLPYDLLMLLKNEILEEVLIRQRLYNPSGPLTMISIFPDDGISEPQIDFVRDTENSVDTYFFIIPYELVISSRDRIQSFVHVFFALLNRLFGILKIDSSRLGDLLDKVMYEIDEAPQKYRNVAPDENGLDDILDELGLK